MRLSVADLISLTSYSERPSIFLVPLVAILAIFSPFPALSQQTPRMVVGHAFLSQKFPCL